MVQQKESTHRGQKITPKPMYLCCLPGITNGQHYSQQTSPGIQALLGQNNFLNLQYHTFLLLNCTFLAQHFCINKQMNRILKLVIIFWKALCPQCCPNQMKMK